MERLFVNILLTISTLFWSWFMVGVVVWAMTADSGAIVTLSVTPTSGV